jgi:multidrug efflux pump
VAILISAVVSLTLTPMMSARLLRPERERKHTRSARGARAATSAWSRGYGVMLNWVLDRPRATLAVFGLTLVLTGLLYTVVPKGFFPYRTRG